MDELLERAIDLTSMASEQPSHIWVNPLFTGQSKKTLNINVLLGRTARQRRTRAHPTAPERNARRRGRIGATRKKRGRSGGAASDPIWRGSGALGGSDQRAPVLPGGGAEDVCDSAGSFLRKPRIPAGWP